MTAAAASTITNTATVSGAQADDNLSEQHVERHDDRPSSAGAEQVFLYHVNHPGRISPAGRGQGGTDWQSVLRVSQFPRQACNELAFFRTCDNRVMNARRRLFESRSKTGKDIAFQARTRF